MPAYEDLFYFLWQEGQIPVNVNPAQADLSDSGERRKLAHLLEQGMETPVGYVLPVRWHEAVRPGRVRNGPYAAKHSF